MSAVSCGGTGISGRWMVKVGGKAGRAMSKMVCRRIVNGSRCWTKSPSWEMEIVPTSELGYDVSSRRDKQEDYLLDLGRHGESSDFVEVWEGQDRDVLVPPDEDQDRAAAPDDNPRLDKTSAALKARRPGSIDIEVN